MSEDNSNKLNRLEQIFRQWPEAERRYLAGESLEAALNLTGVHSRGPRYAYRRTRMLGHLAAAARIIGVERPAAVLAREIAAFRRRWPVLKKNGLRPAAPALDQALYAAFCAVDGDLPQTPKRLRALLADLPHEGTNAPPSFVPSPAK